MKKATVDLFKDFFQSERAGGFVLIGCTIISLLIANSSWGENYHHFWSSTVNLSFRGVELNYTVEQWVNDGLMVIFFLLVGLEIERELYIGELSNFKNALLPILTAAGGMLFPALIHFAFNAGTSTEGGFGIPMATDIAFALGALSLAGNKVPVSLKIFLTAFAIMDDLGAISVIAIFYSKGFSIWYFAGALLVFLMLFIAGKMRVYSLLFYVIPGIVMWYLMLKSGVHSTIAGILLAFSIPYNRAEGRNPSYRLQHILHYPVAFIVLPIFALANTVIIFPVNILNSFTSSNSLGIILGLIVGKFVGIFLVVMLATKLKIATLSPDLTRMHILGVSLLGGIGFTMSIFITNLAFSDRDIIVTSKISVLFASLMAAIIGILILKKVNPGATK